jgi:hypothetical protein
MKNGVDSYLCCSTALCGPLGVLITGAPFRSLAPHGARLALYGAVVDEGLDPAVVKAASALGVATGRRPAIGARP